MSVAYLFAAFLSACGGGNGSDQQGYMLTGTVTGLQGSLTISVGAQYRTVNENGSFDINVFLLSGSNYTVTIIDKPDTQHCTLEGETGVVGTGDNHFNIICADRVLTKDAISQIGDLAFAACLDSTLTELYADEVTNINCSNRAITTAVGTNNFQSLLSLYLPDNPALDEIDISKNTQLLTLNANNTNLSSIDISNNNLYSIELYNTNIASIDLSNNTNVTNLNLSSTSIAAIDVSMLSNLRELNVNNTSLNILNLSGNKKLVTVYASNNNISMLDVSNNVNLQTLMAADNNLLMLNIANCPALTQIVVRNTNIRSIDTSENVNLILLDIHNTSVSSINLANNSDLVYLRITDTNISSLDISSNNSITILYAYSLGMTSVYGVEDLIYNSAEIWLTGNSFDSDTLNMLQDLVDNQGFSDLHF